jgi:hypothetical protein
MLWRRRMLYVLAGTLACTLRAVRGGDATVEVNGRTYTRPSVEIVADGKEMRPVVEARPSSEIVADGKETRPVTLEVNGRRVQSTFHYSRRFLFGQEQILDTEPPLPPSAFNPDPGNPNLAEPPPEPPDLFPPILPQPPEYGEEALPRSLGLPRTGVREVTPERRKLQYESYPESSRGEGLLPGSEPVPNRWFVGFGRWKRYADPSAETTYVAGGLRFWHPYLQSKLKADAPIIGQDIFLNLTLNEFAQFEARRLPVPSGVSTARPESSEFYGRSDQFFGSSDFSIGVDLFKGETAFKPVEWALRFLFVANQNGIYVRENNIVDPDPRGPGYPGPSAVPIDPNHLQDFGGGFRRLPGDLQYTRYTHRVKDWYALQEAFAEIHIRDLTNNYDFISSRLGIQPFVSDFRGFIFNDSNLGARIFGNYDNNKWQYNLIAFDMREKDTYSGLNEFDSRDQQVLIANIFRQDLFAKGYTGELSFHMNLDGGDRHYDKNEFIVRPAPIGAVRDHYVQSYYLGWTGDGHIGRLNISHAFYEALGEDGFNGIAQRRVDINAQMAAVELSVDKDWLRLKLSAFWASGDSDPRNGTATGFDTIFDRPFFFGGPFSYYVHQGFNLGGTSVSFKQGDSLVPDLRTSKSEGQSNFVTPGASIIGYGMDADITPKLKAFVNVNYIWMNDTEVIKQVLFTQNARNDFGLDASLGLQWRPLLTENIVISAGCGFLVPGDGYKDIYRANTRPVPGYDQPSPGHVDPFLFSAIFTVTLTY